MFIVTSGMSLLTKVSTAAFYCFCVTLWLLTTSEVFRKPAFQETLSHDIQKRSRKEASPYFQKLPGTNWTLFDIRFGDISGQQQIVGVPGELSLPEGAEVEVGRMEERLTKEEKGGNVGNKHNGNVGTKNRSTGNHVLVYNRVPKCASETMLSIIRWLAPI